MVGIYKITNKINGKVYIGQSVDIDKRKREHLNNYKRDEIKHYILYRAINKYGVNNFEFEVICGCSIDELDDLEIKYIKLYNSYKGNGYNMTLGGGGVRGLKPWLGKKHTQETKNKIRKSHMGKKLSKETIEKLKSIRKGNKYRLGIKHTKETIEKLRVLNMGENNAMYGKSHSKETKEKISIAKKGKGNSRSRKIICLNDMKIFNSMIETANYYGVRTDSLSNVCRGKYKKTKGYKFMYYDEYLNTKELALAE